MIRVFKGDYEGFFVSTEVFLVEKGDGREQIDSRQVKLKINKYINDAGKVQQKVQFPKFCVNTKIKYKRKDFKDQCTQEFISLPHK